MSAGTGTIVVGVDGSSSSDQALEWAAAQAAAEHRALTLVHAVPPTPPAPLDLAGRTTRAAQHRALLAQGQEVLDQCRKKVHQLAPAVPVREDCHIGDPRSALLDESRSAALVVLGSRGRGPIASLLLGSTAVAVVRHAQCPVVVHRPTTPSSSRHGIAVGTDATDDSLPLLDFAYRQASVRGLPLTVAHTYWYPLPSADTSAIADVIGHATTDLTHQRRALAESMAGFGERYAEVSVHTEFDHGMPERLLLRLSDQMDLIVVGAHHGTRAEQFMFGSMALWLVEHARCPVAVLPLQRHRPS